MAIPLVLYLEGELGTADHHLLESVIVLNHKIEENIHLSKISKYSALQAFFLQSLRRKLHSDLCIFPCIEWCLFGFSAAVCVPS